MITQQFDCVNEKVKSFCAKLLMINVSLVKKKRRERKKHDMYSYSNKRPKNISIQVFDATVEKRGGIVQQLVDYYAFSFFTLTKKCALYK